MKIEAIKTQQPFTPAKFTLELETPEELLALALMANAMTGCPSGRECACDAWSPSPVVMTDAVESALIDVGSKIYTAAEYAMIVRRRTGEM